MLPQVRAQPGPSRVGGPPGSVLSRCREMPRVGHHMDHPTVRPVEGGCRFFSRWNERPSKVDQRGVEFRKVTHLCRPVVHLHVDIQVIIPVPGSLHLISPQALEIQRKAVFSGTTDHQVTPILEIECRERRIVVPLKERQPLVGCRRVVLLP